MKRLINPQKAVITILRVDERGVRFMLESKITKQTHLRTLDQRTFDQLCIDAKFVTLTDAIDNHATVEELELESAR